MDHEKEDKQTEDLHENFYTDTRQDGNEGKLSKYKKCEIEKGHSLLKVNTTKGSSCRCHAINERNANIDAKSRTDHRLIRAGQKMSLHKVTNWKTNCRSYRMLL